MDTTQVQQWFNNLKRQEQAMLLLGAAAVLAYLVFVVILGAMADAESRLQQQNEEAAATLQEVRQLAEEYERLEQQSPAPGQARGNLTRIVDSTVKKNALQMSRFQPSSSGDVQVRFENANFNHILAWLHELENEHGVQVRDLSISPGSASGLVNISVRLGEIS